MRRENGSDPAADGMEFGRRHPTDRDSRPDHIVDDRMVDETLEESFPASDPPSWTAPARIGSPKRDHDATS